MFMRGGFALGGGGRKGKKEKPKGDRKEMGKRNYPRTLKRPTLFNKERREKKKRRNAQESRS